MMTILVLCRRSELPWYGWGYGPALEQLGARFVYVAEETPPDTELRTLLTHCPAPPALIVRPEFPRFPLPWGLAEVDVPTILFQEDTYVYTARRIRWSLLFDYVVLYHPGFEGRFRQAGHAGLLTLPFGVVRSLFDRREEERTFEVGWVGRANSNIYSTRRRILPELASRFRMNDWTRHYSHEEMAKVYCRSKIVVNIARDDYPQDANMRAFEAMAAGALLITRMPSELTALGFEGGVHFVGYRQPEEIVRLVGDFLRDDAVRLRIACAARAKVLNDHTYDSRAVALLQKVQQNLGRSFAPARRWDEAAVRLLYLDFHSSHAHFDLAWGQFRKLAPYRFSKWLAGAWLLGRACARHLRNRLAGPEPIRPWEMPSLERRLTTKIESCLDEHETIG